MTTKIGVFADLHYSAPGVPERERGSLSLDRLKKGLEYFRESGVDFAVSLGDNTHNAGSHGGQLDAMRAVRGACAEMDFPTYLCPGNHEFTELEPDEVKEIWDIGTLYYSFERGGVRFIVLDTCIRPDGVHFSMDNFDWTKSMLGGEQLAWLEGELETGAEMGQRCVIFTHGNILCGDGEGDFNRHFMIAEHETVRALIEKSGNVEYVFQGHRHEYDYREACGTRFVSIPAGMGMAEEDARRFSVFTVRD